MFQFGTGYKHTDLRKFQEKKQINEITVNDGDLNQCWLGIYLVLGIY